MDNDSPFAKTANPIPIIGQPQVINVVAIALMHCNCEAKALLMGPIGPQPFVCGACKKAWVVEAQVQVAVTQIVNPVDSTDRNLIQ